MQDQPRRFSRPCDIEDSGACFIVHDDSGRALSYLALLLQRKGSYAEAVDYWRRCLASDRSSEWASRARRSLKFCEIPDSDKAA